MTGAVAVFAAKLLTLPLICAATLAPTGPPGLGPAAPAAMVSSHGGGHGGHCGHGPAGRHCSSGSGRVAAPVSDEDAATAVALVVIALAAAA